MSKAVFRRRGRTFIPIDQEGLDLLGSIREERDCLVEIKRARNPKHHRLFYAILKFIVEHTDQFDNIEAAKTGIKIACHEVDPVIDASTGKTYFIVRSISYASMDQARFAAFFDRAVYIITARWMPEGTTEESVRAEILAMVEPHSSSPSLAPDQAREREAVT